MRVHNQRPYLGILSESQSSRLSWSYVHQYQRPPAYTIPCSSCDITASVQPTQGHNHCRLAWEPALVHAPKATPLLTHVAIPSVGLFQSSMHVVYLRARSKAQGKKSCHVLCATMTPSPSWSGCPMSLCKAWSSHQRRSRDPLHGAQSTEHGAWSTEHGEQSTEHGARST